MYMMTPLGKNETKKKDFTFVICLYMPKKYGWENEKPVTEIKCSGGGRRMCSMGSWANARKKTFHCIAFYIFWFLNHVNVLPIQKIK